jgi:hypothetical protein
MNLLFYLQLVFVVVSNDLTWPMILSTTKVEVGMHYLAADVRPAKATGTEM